jgi:hypothetical protein
VVLVEREVDLVGLQFPLVSIHRSSALQDLGDTALSFLGVTFGLEGTKYPIVLDGTTLLLLVSETLEEVMLVTTERKPCCSLKRCPWNSVASISKFGCRIDKVGILLLGNS